MIFFRRTNYCVKEMQIRKRKRQRECVSNVSVGWREFPIKNRNLHILNRLPLVRMYKYARKFYREITYIYCTYVHLTCVYISVRISSDTTRQMLLFQSENSHTLVLLLELLISTRIRTFSGFTVAFIVRCFSRINGMISWYKCRLRIKQFQIQRSKLRNNGIGFIYIIVHAWI